MDQPRELKQAIDQRLEAVDSEIEGLQSEIHDLEAEREALLTMQKLYADVGNGGPRVFTPASQEPLVRRGPTDAVMAMIPRDGRRILKAQIVATLDGKIKTTSSDHRNILWATISTLVHRKKLKEYQDGSVSRPAKETAPELLPEPSP